MYIFDSQNFTLSIINELYSMVFFHSFDLSFLFIFYFFVDLFDLVPYSLKNSSFPYWSVQSYLWIFYQFSIYRSIWSIWPLTWLAFPWWVSFFLIIPIKTENFCNQLQLYILLFFRFLFCEGHNETLKISLTRFIGSELFSFLYKIRIFFFWRSRYSFYRERRVGLFINLNSWHFFLKPQFFSLFWFRHWVSHPQSSLFIPSTATERTAYPLHGEFPEVFHIDTECANERNPESNKHTRAQYDCIFLSLSISQSCFLAFTWSSFWFILSSS